MADIAPRLLHPQQQAQEAQMRIGLLLTTALFLGMAGAAPAQEKLTIYTYESFTADWGPGPKVEAAFEEECGCDLEFVSVADGVALLNRARIEGEALKADIILGLDTNLVAEARATGLFVGHELDEVALNVPGGWNDDIFLPYDYGYFAVVYDTKTLTDPPATLKELMEGEGRNDIVIQDPRTSTPGLGLLLWVKAVYGEEAGAAWRAFSDRVLTVTPGWSEAYGLFTGGEAPMVLSYTTSPAYHMIEEGTDRYQAVSFEEGHYIQIEVAGITVKGAGNPLARRFMRFMTTPAFQDIIPTTNWMYPAGETSKPLPAAFNRLVKPVGTLMIDPETVAENREAWIAEWLSAMSR
jgi:thiamine transport system substrate-binding protein